MKRTVDILAILTPFSVQTSGNFSTGYGAFLCVLLLFFGLAGSSVNSQRDYARDSYARQPSPGSEFPAAFSFYDIHSPYDSTADHVCKIGRGHGAVLYSTT